MVPKFRAYLKEEGIIVDVQEINYKYEEIAYKNGKYMEVADFKDIELLQSTGLKDVNNIEVFENDMAKVHEFTNIGVDAYKEGEKETIGIIEYGCLYDSPISEWYLQIKDDCVSFSYMDLHEESFEVIGNVYKHPHLLEE